MIYQIKILTPQGVKEIIFNNKEKDVERLEIELIKKYGQFTTLSSKQIG
jgi:hypothetical protein